MKLFYRIQNIYNNSYFFTLLLENMSIEIIHKYFSWANTTNLKEYLSAHL